MSGRGLLPERIGSLKQLHGRLLLPGGIFRADGVPGGNVQLCDQFLQYCHVHGVRRGDLQHGYGRDQFGHVRGVSGGELLPHGVGKRDYLPGRQLLPGGSLSAHVLWAGNVQQRDRRQQFRHLHLVRGGNV